MVAFVSGDVCEVFFLSVWAAQCFFTFFPNKSGLEEED